MGNQNYRTPPWLLALLEREVLGGKRFKLDAAATRENAVCKRYHDEAANGLLQPWADPTYCNPPYRAIELWIAKACREAEGSGLVACVVGPKGCSQAWFHEWAKRGTIWAPDQRIAFLDPDTGAQTESAREDSMVYSFGPGHWHKGHDFKVRALGTRAAREAA